MHIITKYYNFSASVLSSYLPVIPKLKLSDAQSYYGKITRKNGEYISVTLSKHNLDCGNWNWWDDEDIIELIDTIAHEFAHMIYWTHSEDHYNLTEKFKNTIIKNLKYLKELI